jgi:mannose-6-phosphate isomerase-like protein (cupin superfamily)
MKKLSPIVAAIVAFTAGFGVAHLPAPARAALPPITPQYLDLNTYPIERGKPPLVAEDNATVIVQAGPVPKHYHANTDEIQYVIEGTGTEWLGDQQVDLKPGIMLIIPKGTPHGGSVVTSGSLRLLAIKIPPQAPDDMHLLP